jgi:glycine/D-amino acid oxidase-like deaminating enzyme
MRGGGWVDVPAFLDAVGREIDRSPGCGRATAEVIDDDVEVTAESVAWRGVRARHLIFCQGFEGARNRFFDWVPFRSAKGEVLDLAVDGFGDERVVSGMGGWLLPTGRGGFRAGSTYSWDPLDNVPTKQGRRRIERTLVRFLEPRFAVVGHRAGVRPIINASRVLMGLHPAHERVGFFNGLGSKGVLNAPFFAGQLAAHLTAGNPLDEAVDLRKNG